MLNIPGEVHTYPCERIKVRVIKSLPIIVVSGNKLHDTYFNHLFLLKKLLGVDGAGSHFKQRGSIHFTTFLCVFLVCSYRGLLDALAMGKVHGMD